MANQKHLDILKKKGVKVWNDWREDHPGVKANLSGAFFRLADLSWANLSEAQLTAADLTKANLREAQLTAADLTAADLSGADLSGADFSGQDLSGQDLSGQDLSGANLRNAHLIEADLHAADLSEANLRGADLRLADLRETDLRGADLGLVNLVGAKLEGSKIDPDQLDSATLSMRQLIDRGIFSGVLPGTDNDPTKTIVREIEFPPEHHQAGLSILEYFGTVIRQKYPDISIKVRIEQEDLKVRMVVETPEGKKEQIEKALTDYGLVVVGEKPPSDLLEDRFQILQLEQTLKLEKVWHETTLRLLETEQRHSEQLSGRYDQLLGFLGEKLIQQPQATSLVVNVEVLPKLRDSLRESERLTAEERQEALDLLDQLRAQAELSEKDRLDKGTLGKMFGRLSQLAGIAGAAASIWQTFGPQIGAVLGIVSK